MPSELGLNYPVYENSFHIMLSMNYPDIV